MNKIVRYYVTLSLWLIAFQLIGSLMGIITQSNIAEWYIHLNKSQLTPPDITFAIVWSLLYLLVAYLGFAIFNWADVWYKKKAKFVYVLQMLLNWSWTPVFFYFHKTGFALMILGMMFVLNGYLCALLWKTSRTLALLNGIYETWLGFAFYLNLYIYLNN